MPNFIDRLSEKLSDAQTREQLRQTLSKDALPHEASLQRLVQEHWRTLPKIKTAELRPAFAVDGSRAVRHLANGAYLFVAQALIVGERAGQRLEATDVDVRILPGATPTPFVERFAELMMHRLEATLARDHAKTIPQGGVIFLDGALYGQLPQLYQARHDIGDNEAATFAKEALNENVEQILRAYLHLFQATVARNLWLISIAKTSREATHTKVWWRNKYSQELGKDQEISDSEVIYRWTERAAGYSTPILFGKRSFAKQPEAVVFDKVKDAPAIASFFVRLADFDDALRIDVPAICLGRAEKIGDIETDAEILLDQPADLERVATLLELLRADYGGLEVYNALLYSVDREVRLRQEMMDEVYLSLIQNSLGADIELRLDRSERRFHST
ncbi:MAG: DNA double-strand break repair nuclease NurA [Anaerolineales bacterium]|nr:DNA double-strand break repair nuclease NurA [Anaerolineales bacterium]